MIELNAQLRAEIKMVISLSLRTKQLTEILKNMNSLIIIINENKDE